MDELDKIRIAKFLSITVIILGIIFLFTLIKTEKGLIQLDKQFLDEELR